MEDLNDITNLAKAGIQLGSEKVEGLVGPPKDPKKLLFWAKYHTITNIILILVIAAVGIYLWKNLSDFKTLSSDVCRLCEAKTGGICSKVLNNIAP